MATANTTFELTFHPLTPGRWPDFERLFGLRGAYGGCWCMWWRCKRADFSRNGNTGNRQAMKDIVEGGEIPGLLAYHDNEPVGWVAVAPRQDYGPLNRSPVLKRVDDQPVWSLVCLFVDAAWQGRGVGLALIEGAIAHVRAQGGRTVEAYPTVPRSQRLPEMHAFMGTPEMFSRLGFVEIKRASAAKMIMRYEIED